MLMTGLARNIRENLFNKNVKHKNIGDCYMINIRKYIAMLEDEISFHNSEFFEEYIKRLIEIALVLGVLGAAEAVQGG
jgi:hypothetical protein